MSIGARSQSAKTYLEAHFNEFAECKQTSILNVVIDGRSPCCRYKGDLPTLIKHGLHALRDTLQQDKELTPQNTSLGIVGISTGTDAPSSTEPSAPVALGAAAQTGFQKFRIIEGADLQVYLDSMDPKETPGNAEPATTSTTSTSTADAPTTTGSDEPSSMETD